MNGVPWHGLLAGFLFLHVAATFYIQPEFRANKYTGKWYTIGIVLSQGTLTNTNSHQMTVEEEDNDRLRITVWKPEDGCSKIEFDLYEGEKPGQYIRVSGNRNSTITIVDTDYDSFCILGMENSYLRALHLYSRNEDVSDDVKGKYADYAKCTNFPVSDIIYLTKPEAWC